MAESVEWMDVGPLADIPRQGARIVAAPGGNIAVFRTHDDRVFALDDKCPHQGGPLSQGIVHGHGVTCPLHSWVIDLPTGEARAPDEGCVAVRPVRLKGERVELGLESGELATVDHG